MKTIILPPEDGDTIPLVNACVRDGILAYDSSGRFVGMVTQRLGYDFYQVVRTNNEKATNEYSSLEALMRSLPSLTFKQL